VTFGKRGIPLIRETDSDHSEWRVVCVPLISLSFAFYRRYSLMVHMTSVKLLGLVSLESIENGAVAIVGNAQLCYMGNIPWHDLRHSRNQSIIVRGNKASDNCGRILGDNPLETTPPRDNPLPKLSPPRLGILTLTDPRSGVLT